MKKKTIYTFAAAILLSAGIAVAQTPTPATQLQPTPGANFNTVNPSFGTQINSSSIPDPLRSTLQGTQYKGWENGTMYFNQSTNQYSLQMATPNQSINPLTPTPNPSTPTTPATPSPTTPASPATPNPMGGLQTTPAAPGSPAVAAPVTIYRFDQNGKLIPQSKP